MKIGIMQLNTLTLLNKMSKKETLTSIRPTGSASITNISGGMDFTSLYQSTMTMYFHFHSKQRRRKWKIINIFIESQNNKI